jgi:hypothetical protein
MFYLVQITRTREGEYETVFGDNRGHSLRVSFRVEVDRGVPLVKPNPDLFMDGRADPRSVSAAVLAFHRAQKPASTKAPEEP